MTNNFVPPILMRWLQLRWSLIIRIFFWGAIGTWVLRFYLPQITKLSDVLFILMFSSYLFSQRIEGRTINAVEKSFSYFMIYLLGFFLVKDLSASIFPRGQSRLIQILYLCSILGLMTYQSVRYIREAGRRSSVVWLSICFLLAVLSLLVSYWVNPIRHLLM